MHKQKSGVKIWTHTVFHKFMLLLYILYIKICTDANNEDLDICLHNKNWVCHHHLVWLLHNQQTLFPLPIFINYTIAGIAMTKLCSELTSVPGLVFLKVIPKSVFDHCEVSLFPDLFPGPFPSILFPFSFIKETTND